MPAVRLADFEVAALCSSDDPTIARLADEVRSLRAGIGIHRSQTGHSLCWLNDVELWRLLEPDPAYPHDTLPVREEFLRQCRAYHESRLKGLPYEEPDPEKTVL